MQSYTCKVNKEQNSLQEEEELTITGCVRGGDDRNWVLHLSMGVPVVSKKTKTKKHGGETVFICLEREGKHSSKGYIAPDTKMRQDT